ncbi:MAG: DEAD/DEAH box helicase [Ilumatobacteraceae bacterium]
MVRRDVSSLSLQLTWHENSLHLWALDRTSLTTASVVDLMNVVDQQVGPSVARSAFTSRIPVKLANGAGDIAAQTLRINAAALDELPLRCPTPSLQWFADLARLARRAMRAGRIRPLLEISGPVHAAHWIPVSNYALDQALAELHASMPAVCAVNDINRLFESLIDALVRNSLNGMAWRPPQPRHGRGSDYRAAQATFRGLASTGGKVLYRNDDLPALAELGRIFAHEADRAAGLPVLAAQLRLQLPELLDDPWLLTLELVDIDQPDHYCTAADVLDGTAAALDLARRADQLPRLRDRIRAASERLADHLGPALSPFKVFADDPAGAAELELEQTETFLVTAPELLEQIDIRLLGPEQLIKVRAGVRASAAPRVETAASGRFSAGALVQWDATVDDAPIDDAQLQRAAAAGNSLIHVGGRWVRLDTKQVRSTLERLQRHRDNDAELDVGGLLKLAADAAAGDSAAGVLSITAAEDAGWITDLLDGLPDERLIEMREPDSFTGELRHYQRRGLSWMGFLSRLGLGGCLADDMGLGKTATTLAHLSTRPGPHLVVCPLSVVHNWYSEAARFTPDLQVAIHHGNDRARGDSALGQLIPADIVVTTYGLLARDVDTLAAVQWGTVVLDEAQAIKNHLTRAAKAVRQIGATQKLALTGTPVENHLGELWAILDAVNPGLYGSASQFTDRYARPIQRNGDPAATAALRTLTQPFVLRRTKADKTLLPELPDKIEQIAWSTLTKEQAAMYQAVVDRLLADAQAETGMKRRGMVLAALTRLKQICNHPAHAAGDGSRLAGRSGKLNRFDEIVDDLLELDERALVFTQFREMGLLLQRHLRERLQMDAPFLHGGVSRTGRDAMVHRFQSGEGAPLLLVSLKAGGTGLNLTSASQVIHYDRWWNPAVEDQATDRAWRLGQDHTVLVHKMVCEGTLEERISQLIDDKKALANSVLGTGEQWLTELSTDDLRSLVALSPTGLR